MAPQPDDATAHPQAEDAALPHGEAPRLGGYVLRDEPIELNRGRPRTTMMVSNTGDRPVQVGSHFHFFEANRYLAFDRRAAFGLRLDIPASTAVRFEAGETKEVTLVPFGGKRFAFGFSNLVDGWTGDGPNPDHRPNRDAAVERAGKRGFRSGTPAAEPGPNPAHVTTKS
jgi:urease subunit beta